MRKQKSVNAAAKALATGPFRMKVIPDKKKAAKAGRLKHKGDLFVSSRLTNYVD